MSAEFEGAQTPAEIYEHYMVPAIFMPWVPALLDLTKLQAGERLLDVACGTGVVGRYAMHRIGRGGRVVGLDMNPQMLQVARAVEPSIEWKEGNALELPFPDQSFDVVTCQQGIQFFPDRLKAIAEMRRVLVHGGRLAVAVWCSIECCPGYAALLAGLERHIGPSAANSINAIFSFDDAVKLHDLLEAAQFKDAAIHRDTRTVGFPSSEVFVSAMLGGSNLARSGIRIEADVLDALKSDISASLQPYVSSAGLRFPMEAHLAVAHK